MVKEFNGSDTRLPSQVELELLAALLEPDDNSYPWNPAAQESEAYFLQLEQQFALQEVLDEELDIRSQAMAHKLDELWSEHTHDQCNTINNTFVVLKETLQNSFATLIPTHWLNQIARKAVEIYQTQQSIGDKIVECVQDVLPNWAADDLFVLARPLAYSMRSGENNGIELVLNKLGNHEWTNLSEVEQAKVSVALAYYAISQLNQTSTEL
ncbi:hypothetical protein [Iningainema tapete]|uniref:Uncharacterized protein n=1 Tax=Iningainema tapete BLCC-T55 TaxID=2748662 RepID=A0A8J6XPJ0_9CYAN|nr:hypothetical protein [Iningainema tapete]MBD2777087.1 hypothetical protein [Iningainema tapete BLCC-T55]